MKRHMFLMIFFTVCWCAAAAKADTCMTSAELIDYITFSGWSVNYTEDYIVLTAQLPSDFPGFTYTVTELWGMVGEAYCNVAVGYDT